MTKRRVKGEGSVYRRKDGRVIGEWVDANGRKRHMTSTEMSKAEMKAAIRKKHSVSVAPDYGIPYNDKQDGKHYFTWQEPAS